MAATPRRPRPAPELETNTAPDVLREDSTSPDAADSRPADGDDRHALPDEDQEDAPLSEYERELDRLDAATRSER
jgi:hypothetical protein